MKKILLLLVIIIAFQFSSYGQDVSCEPQIYPNRYDCDPPQLCSTDVDLGNCGSFTVYFSYTKCQDIISGGYVCTFKIENLNIPPACYYEFLGREIELFDIVMGTILAEAYNNAGCGWECNPTPINPCGWYNDFYLSSCWRWTGISPTPGNYTLEQCSDKGCCKIDWQVCIIDGMPQYIKLGVEPVFPCTRDPQNPCDVIICEDL